ncbi:nucleotide exchange factor GrpE [Saccharicrinis sp. FJH54]|uniref:nucleotide exchange factor GrpE n=1 Tax=Saccharicrinis sp. FJH54 TaxID=3344665 RepID=UPI0035D514BA
MAKKQKNTHKEQQKAAHEEAAKSNVNNDKKENDNVKINVEEVELEAAGEVDTEKEELKAECEEKADDLTLVKRAYEELNDKHLRLQAEFDNYRKRTLREKMELTKSAGESILVSLLPVIDDFERAQQMLHDAADIESVRQGFELIYSKFVSFLNQNGVKPIETTEKEFDTDLHEAVTKIPAPKEELKGKVVDCIQKGYLLNDKVIRYSKVVIGE